MSCYGRDIVEATSKKMNLPVSKISEHEETYSTSLFSMLLPLGSDSIAKQDEIYNVQERMVSWIASATSSSFLRYADAILYIHCKCSSISLQKASLSSFFALRIKNSLFIDFSILLFLTGHQEMLCKSFCLCASTY